MSEHDTKTPGDTPFSGVKLKPAYADSKWRASMDPNYSSHTGPFPWDTATSRSSYPSIQAADFRYMHALGPEQRRIALRRQLLMLPWGRRIRNLRLALAWTQATVAMHLGVSVRTAIRHEQGRNRRPWLRLPLMRRLCELESEHAEALTAYLSRVGPERA